VELLLDLGTYSTSAKYLKRGFSYINTKVFEIPIYRHKHIKIPTKKDYTTYKKIRFSDNLPKQVALAEITRNRYRNSTRKTSWYSYK
jgi:hypothetical protein